MGIGEGVVSTVEVLGEVLLWQNLAHGEVLLWEVLGEALLWEVLVEVLLWKVLGEVLLCEELGTDCIRLVIFLLYFLKVLG